MKWYEIPEKVVVKRFWSDFEKAKSMAHILFRTSNVKEPVFITKSVYGIFFSKQTEYRIITLSEGIRPDSIAIAYTIDYDNQVKELRQNIKRKR